MVRQVVEFPDQDVVYKEQLKKIGIDATIGLEAAGPSRLGYLSRHLLKLLALAARMNPRLRTTTIDFHRWREHRRVVKSTNQDYRKSGERLRFRHDSRSAVRTKAAVHGFAGVALIFIRLEFALNTNACTREGHHRLESRTSVALTVTAMAESTECRLAAKGVTDAPTQASSSYIGHQSLPKTEFSFSRLWPTRAPGN